MQIRSQRVSGTWRRATGAVLCAVALFATSGLSGTLCVGADGHVALEPARGGVCVDGEETPHAPPGSTSGTVSLGTSDGCGPCLDVASAPSELVSAAQPQPPDPSAVLAALSDSSSLHVSALPLLRRASTRAPAPAALSILKGTILRC